MCVNFKILLISCFILICVLICGSYEQLDGNDNSVVTEGSPCSKLSVLGTCEKVINCPIAQYELKKKGRHDLKRCGFIGKDEVVCCPDVNERIFGNSSDTTTELYVFASGTTEGTINRNKPKKRKCQAMCEKIYTDNKIKPDIDFHILNGENASSGQFPHMVAVGFENQDEQMDWRCGGALISSKFVLTAAHCLFCSGCDPKKARMGTVDIIDIQIAQDYDIINATIHPEYNSISRHNDIALLELAQDVRMTKIIYPACLYTETNDPLGLQISGWGQTESDNQQSKARILQYARIEPVPVPECNKSVVAYDRISAKTILESQICATTKSDACLGDSGGPLQVLTKEGGYEIVGVISYGIGCGTNIPGIYTRVSRYLDWIENQVWPD